MIATSIAVGGVPWRFAVEIVLRLKALVLALVKGVRAHSFLYVLTVFTYSLAGTQSLRIGLPMEFNFVSPVIDIMLFFLFPLVGLWLMVEFVRLWFTGYRGDAVLALKSKLLDDILAPERIANAVHTFIFMSVFGVGFVAIKKTIPLVQPFAWDKSFMEFDRNLHFGLLPHEILAPLLQFPLAVFIINAVYNLWFAVLVGCLFWQGFARRDNPLRQRFLASIPLTWLIGTGALGTMFSSAGPCYYGFIVAGENPYAPLMAHLRQVNDTYPIWSLTTQDILWKSSLVNYNGSFGGISAMPSMHVATAVLFVLLGFASGKRWLGWCFIVFTISIFVGSVMLGWHYAVDGYAGVAIALACWWLAGKLTLNSRPSSAPR